MLFRHGEHEANEIQQNSLYVFFSILQKNTHTRQTVQKRRKIDREREADQYNKYIAQQCQRQQQLLRRLMNGFKHTTVRKRSSKPCTKTTNRINEQQRYNEENHTKKYHAKERQNERERESKRANER